MRLEALSGMFGNYSILLRTEAPVGTIEGLFGNKNALESVIKRACVPGVCRKYKVSEEIVRQLILMQNTWRIDLLWIMGIYRLSTVLHAIY